MDLFRLFAQDFTRCLMDCLDYLFLCLRHFLFFLIFYLFFSLSTSHLFIIFLPLNGLQRRHEVGIFLAMRINDEIMRNYEEEGAKDISFTGFLQVFLFIIEKMNLRFLITRNVYIVQNVIKYNILCWRKLNFSSKYNIMKFKVTFLTSLTIMIAVKIKRIVV